MTRRSMAYFVVGAAVLFMPVGCGNLEFIGPELVLTRKHGGPSLGYLKHRGRLYDIRNLMDPEYRATSDDEFVRSFDPEVLHAYWAGM